MNKVSINPHLIRCTRKDSQPSGLDYTPANPGVSASAQGSAEGSPHLSSFMWTLSSSVEKLLAKRRCTTL